MNLAALAKVMIRLPMAYLLLVYLLPRLLMEARFSFYRGVNFSNLLIYAIGIGCYTAIWIFAGRIAILLLPAGSSREPAGYEAAERIGLIFIGAWMLAKLVVGVVAGFFALGAISLETSVSYFVTGLVLLIGWRPLVGVLARPFRAQGSKALNLDTD